MAYINHKRLSDDTHEKPPIKLCHSRSTKLPRKNIYVVPQRAFEKFAHEKRDGFSTMSIPTLAQFPPFETEFLCFSHTQEGIVPRGNVVHPLDHYIR